MSRGKYRRRHQHRDERATTHAVARLRLAIADEDRQLAAARQLADQVAAARARLAQETTLAHRRLAPAESDARQRADRVARPWQQVRDALTDLRRVDDRLTPLRALPHRPTRATATARAVHARSSGIRVSLTGVHPSAPTRYLKHSYRTILGAGDPETALTLDNWVPNAIPTDRATLARYARSTALDTTPEAGWTWTVPPWLRLPDGTDAPRLRAALGATTTGTPALDQSYLGPGLPVGATITLPWRPRPLIDDPTDAADLAHWYQRSGWAQGWPPATPPIDAAMPTGADPCAAGPPTPGSECKMVPFWIPGEFCAGFPAGRPLPDLSMLRLPFPVMFACFAHPWYLPPHPDHGALGARGEGAEERLQWPYQAMLHARGPAHHRRTPPVLHDVLFRLQATVGDRARLPTPLQVIAEFGAQVDGLLLTAHPDSTPRDEFAWCLTVPHPWGTPLARIAVPASRSHTAWPDPVNNILTAIALSSWHPTPSPAPEPNTAAPARPSPANSVSDVRAEVRVLDIDATTTRATPRPAAATSSARQPHLRRGHWRHQRVGPGRTHTRPTWVRPTTVNPHDGTPIATQVYRLPTITAP